MTWIWTWTAATLAVTLAGPAPDASAQDSRIRPLGPDSKRILTAGIEHSPTLRGLVEQIEASDLTVYIVTSFEPGHWKGNTRLVSAAGSERVVMVTLNRSLQPTERTAILGHELQHVAEIAGAPAAGDQNSVRLLFAKLGTSTTSKTTFETRAAQDVERRVRHELTIR
jgi:hypothetical protein